MPNHATIPWMTMLFCLPQLFVPRAEISSPGATLFLDFEGEQPPLQLHHGAQYSEGPYGRALEFSGPLDYAEMPFSKRLDGLKEMTIGGWFFVRCSGEQYFLSRGLPQVAQQGERMFRPQPEWVNFVLGSDQHGFFLGTINGNGYMPFPYVTISEIYIDEWQQLVVVKRADGSQRFYQNGSLIHNNAGRMAAKHVNPFHDTGEGEPIRLMMPGGGLIGEAWIFGRAVSDEEVRGDFETKRARYNPTLPHPPVPLREMNTHYAPELWKEAPTARNWPEQRKRIQANIFKVMGPFPSGKVPIDPQISGEEDCGAYLRRKISIQVQQNDRMPAYLLIPKNLKGRAPAVICFYGTTSGAGKDTTVGLSGGKPGSAPHPNLSFAVDLAEAGFVAFAADYLRDGERIKPGHRPYDTTDFYKEFPHWSIVGKDAWDNQRAVDYLQSLPFVDPERIGMTGHSYGGHSTIFAAALEPRIKVVVANGPVSDFLHHGLHWAVPPGAGNSQSLPGMRPYVLDHTLPIPVTFYEFSAMIAPRPFLCGEAAGERRPMEEENYAAVKQVYDALGVPQKVHYHWYAGDHDFGPETRAAAVGWFKKWFAEDLQGK